MRKEYWAAALGLCASGPALAEEIEMASLEVITVTATRSQHSVAEAPATVTVIGEPEIVAKGATDLAEAVRATPGVSLLGQQVGGRRTLSLRGTESQHTLILIAGRRVSATSDVIGHSDFQYGWVPLSQVERIEVVRGPMSALYGSEAMGGVINIVTKQAEEVWSGQAMARGDVNFDSGGDGRQFSLSAGGPLGDMFSVGFSAEDFREDDVPLVEDPLLSEIEGRRRQGATVDLAFKPAEGHTLTARFLENWEDRWRGNRQSSGQRLYFRDEYDLRRSQQSVGYRGEWGKVGSEIYYTRSEFDVVNSRSNNVAPTRPQNLVDHVVDGHVSTPAGKRNLLTVGGEYRRETLNNAGLLGGADSANHKAVYLQDELKVFEGVTLTLGARNDSHTFFGSEFSPRAYAVWRIADSLVVKGGYGEAFRAPTLKQISPNYVGAEGPHTFYGNGDIRPETSRSYELGIDWTRDKTSVVATVFRNDIRDLIDVRLLSVQGIRRFYIYDNISVARLEGFEASLRQDLGEGFELSGNYLYLNGEDRQNAQKLTGRPKHSLNGSLHWASGRWQATLTGEMIGRQFLEGTNGLERAPSYVLGHISGSYEFSEHFRVQLGLSNLGDVRLRDKSALFGYVEPGRTVYASLSASF